MQARKEYGPSQGEKMLAGLRLAAEQIEREEFEKIVNPPVIQFEFNFTKPDPEVDNR